MTTDPANIDERELLTLAMGLMPELKDWIASQRMSEPESAKLPEDDEEKDPREHFEALERFDKRDRTLERVHKQEREQAYMERFSPRMLLLWDGCTARKIHPDVTRPKYEAGGVMDMIIDWVIKDLELLILRLKARVRWVDPDPEADRGGMGGIY